MSGGRRTSRLDTCSTASANDGRSPVVKMRVLPPVDK